MKRLWLLFACVLAVAAPVGLAEESAWAAKYTINGESKLCSAGSAFVIPPNAVHSATVVSDKPARLVDIFTPPRNIMEPLNFADR